MANSTIRDRSQLNLPKPMQRTQLFEFPELEAFAPINTHFSTVIFDFDGTLGDSMWVWDDIDFRFCDEYGLVLPETYADEISAMSFEDTAKYFISDLGLQMTVPEICDKFNELAFRHYADDVLCKPGVKKYLRVLKQRGVALAIATSLSWPLLQAALESNGITEYFDDIAFCDECHKNKQYADVYLLAAQRVGARPQDCLVFEDIAPGCKSARSVGMSAVGVLDCRRNNDNTSLIQAADACIESFEELV